MDQNRAARGGAASIPPLPDARLGLSAGWWVVLGAALCMMVGGGLTFWSLGIYVKPLEQEFGWSRAQLSGAVSVMFLVGGLTGPFVGLAVDRWGARRPIIAGAVLLGVAYLLLAGISELWHLYAMYALMAFIRSWVNYIPFFWLVSRWFPNSMGAPVGIMGVGFSSAGVIFVPLVTWMAATWGWRWSFALSGMMIAAVTVPIALLMLREPPRPLMPAGQRRPADPLPGMTLRQALRTRRFWLISGALGLFFMGLTSFLFHAVPFYLSRGLSESEAAGWVGAGAALATAFRFGMGYMVDRIPNLRLFAVIEALCPGVALAILALSTETPALAAFVLLWAFGSAGGPMLETVLLTRAFGPANFGAILGAVGVAETAGNIVGPFVGGAVYDATGAYTAAFLFYILCFGLAALAFGLSEYPAAWRPAPATAQAGNAAAP